MVVYIVMVRCTTRNILKLYYNFKKFSYNKIGDVYEQNKKFYW